MERSFIYSNMTPMDSLLSAIDSVHPIQLPQIKRSRQSSPMSIESMLDTTSSSDAYEFMNQNNKRMFIDHDEELYSDNNNNKKRFIYDHHDSVVLPPLSPISASPGSPSMSSTISSPVSQAASLSPPPPPSQQTSTVTCYHASVAQKSYGSEKRFLCPPPFVEMSSSSNQAQDLTVSMSVVCETLDKQFEQRSQLDEQQRGYFKYLHVSGTAKAKQFCLRVNLSQPTKSVLQPLQPFTSFYSNPIAIISKPSKKTAKTRNASSCFFNNSLVSLFNRINSQTVRTKYMSSENKQLCAKHSSWSPFEIIVVRQPNQVVNPENHSVSVPVTYGTEIILKDTTTGVSSPPVIIRKVEKGNVVPNAYGLMSQMQKIALQLSSSTSQQPLYLSANGAIMQYQEENNNDTNNNNNNSVNHSTNSWLEYVPSKRQSNNMETIDDHLCWTMVGISKFEYTLNTDNNNNMIDSTNTTTATSMIPSTFYNTTWENMSSQQIRDNLNSPPPSPPRSIVPFPVISSIHYNASTHSLTIFGLESSSRRFEFWLGHHAIHPVLVHDDYLTLRLPSELDQSKCLPFTLTDGTNNTFSSGKGLKYDNNSWTVIDM